jgi:hypothetical protein
MSCMRVSNYQHNFATYSLELYCIDAVLPSIEVFDN